jgi:flagellar biogenesis protein FliO
MHSRFITKQLVALGAFAAVLISSYVYGADPKVVKASHVQAAADDSLETVDSKPEDMSYSPQWPEPPNTGAILTRLGFWTVVVMGVSAATLWLGKPWLQRLQVKTAGNPKFFIEASLTAGNRATLYLVRVGNTQLVAGTDASGLKSLIAIPPTFKEVLDEQVPEVEAEVAQPSRVDHPLDPSSKVNSTNEGALAALQRPTAGQSLFRSSSKD